MIHPISKLAEAIEQQQPAVLATVIEIKGVSPAKIGAQIVLLVDGTTAGTPRRRMFNTSHPCRTMRSRPSFQQGLSISGPSDPAIVGKVIRSELRRTVARNHAGPFTLDKQAQAIATPFPLRLGRSLAR